MPELPEVETIRRTLEPYLLGRTVKSITVRNGNLRSLVCKATLESDLCAKQFIAIRRRAKYLLCDLSGTEDSCLLLHLGMTGTLGVVTVDHPLRSHDHILWTLDNGTQLRFHDPRRFGAVTSFPAHDEQTHYSLAHLGLEPLSGALHDKNAISQLYAHAKRSKRAIKQWLMDGKIIVGIGNIYASEVLFGAGISPKRGCHRISKKRFIRLLAQVVITLEQALAAGGTTLQDYRTVTGEQGYFQISLNVYGKAGQPCAVCSKPIKQIRQAGRSTFYCGDCQR